MDEPPNPDDESPEADDARERWFDEHADEIRDAMAFLLDRGVLDGLISDDLADRLGRPRR